MARKRGLLIFSAALIGCAALTASADYSVTDVVGAAKRGDGHAVHRLIGAGADLDVRGPMGYTALHWAAIRAHWAIFTELVGAGASVNAVGSDGGTPLHWACHHDRPDMIALLIAAGAEVNTQNRWGRTPLHVAARRGCDGVATALLDHGADIEAVTAEGWTPLHVASRSDHPAMVSLLIGSGADTTRLDGTGITAAESHRPRPAAVTKKPSLLIDYEGIYDLGDGLTVKVWREGDGLRIREFAPDDLVPIGGDSFFCRQEPWQVDFDRTENGIVDGLAIRFLRRTVHASKTPSPRYVGSQVCLNCHRSQHVRWLQSRHAHAYWRLGADWALFLGRTKPHYQDLENPRTDQRCTLCHVTGAQDDDALYSETFRPEEGVSCESCHGPGSNYAEQEIMTDREAFLSNGGRVPGDSACRSCHRNSDRFDRAEWWPEIAHPNPQPAQMTGL
jgi:hypothetical protein